jgi:hypothetical protein
VASLASFDLLVFWILESPSSIPRNNFADSFHSLELRLDTPEASASEDSSLKLVHIKNIYDEILIYLTE